MIETFLVAMEVKACTSSPDGCSGRDKLIDFILYQTSNVRGLCYNAPPYLRSFGPEVLNYAR